MYLKRITFLKMSVSPNGLMKLTMLGITGPCCYIVLTHYPAAGLPLQSSDAIN